MRVSISRRTGCRGALALDGEDPTVVVEFWGARSGSSTMDGYHYTADLPVPFDPGSRGTYWFSVQGAEQFGNWFWYECEVDDYWEAEAAFRSSVWGFPDWVPFSDHGSWSPRLAFTLFVDDESALSESAWGGLKSLFR